MTMHNDSAAILDDLIGSLRYEPDTGELTWLVTRGKAKAGSPAGFVTRFGYVMVGFSGLEVFAHRIAWRIAKGQWPTGHIDHINGVGTDNRIANLRDVSRAVNMQNLRTCRKDNKAGFLGVSPNRNRWSASIKVGAKKRHLGTFDTPAEAHEAYLKAKRQLHEGCTL